MAGAAPAPNTDVAVVVNPDVPADRLSMTELRALLFGDRQFWSSRLRVTVLMPSGRERAVVLKRVYQMTEPQFRRFWISKLFRAETPSAPKIVYSTDMALELAAAIPGALALVEAGRIPKTLKVIRIDGLLPGDKRYRLR